MIHMSIKKYITQNQTQLIFALFKSQKLMGNKILRPDPQDQFAPFNDDQKVYLKDKYENLCDQKTKRLSAQKISTELQTTRDVANNILLYIDFEGKGEVDFYEFMCAAASVHQDDEQAQQFLFDLFKSGQQIEERSLKSFFQTVFNYLNFMDLIRQKYDDKIGEQKFKQYDYNKNGTMSLDEFRSLLENDYHCGLWMQTLGFAEEKEIERKDKPMNHQIKQDDEFGEAQDSGDQAGSTPSWIQTIKKMSDDTTLPKRINPPNQKLQINYIYGYRSYDTRSNLKYNINSEIVYHHAGCGIILNKLKNTQKINTQHNDDITCLDVNVKKNLVVTGQMGRKPAVVVWDASTAQTKAVFQNKLEHSIGCVAISPSGKYVAASSMSDNHQIAVYDIANKSLIAFGKGPRSVIFQIKFNSEENQIICACAKQVVFAHFQKGKLQCKRGVFGKAPCLPCYSIAVLKNNQCLISMQNGLLTLWKGSACSKIFKEHSKPVGALCERQNGGVISGDADGNIILWTNKMAVEKTLDLKKLVKSSNPRIISLCQLYGNVLIGTRGGEIIEFVKGNAQILIEGHFDGQLWGLAGSSSRLQFFTGGQDKLLMKWDINKRKCIDKKKLDAPINCLDLSRNNTLAVGMRNGVVSLFDGGSLKFIKSIFKHKNPDKDMISIIKFSPDGNKLAVGYAPPFSCIYIYDINNLDANPKKCTGSPSRINSIDFSRNSNAILINNTSYEILFYDTNSGQQKKSATEFKGEEWATLTARFSWGTQGIWPPCSDGSDVNAVDRSNSKKFVVTGDDFSKVKIFDYPVCQKNQIYNAYKGHSSHITGIKWTLDDKYLISTGGLEKSIIQWTNTTEEEIKTQGLQQLQVVEKQQQVPVEDNEEYEFDALEGDNRKEAKKNKEDDDSEFGEDEDEGDQRLAVLPFLGQVNKSTPSQYAVASRQNLLPQEDLVIDHVWGIRNQYLNDRVRNQLKYSANYDSCLFITAALGVEMNLQTKKQTFYQKQSEDLISFAISPDRKICATGQMAQLNKNSPKNKIIEVHVWDAETKEKKAVLSKFHQRGIYIVSFSPSGNYVLTIGQDDKNSLAVYDWKNQRIVWSSPVSGDKVTGAAWKSETQYMTCGAKHIKFWDKGKGTMVNMSVLPGKKIDPMLSAVCWNGKYVSGGLSGAVYLWNGNSATAGQGHKKKVDCLAVDQSGTLFSGDAEGKILTWKISGGKLVCDKQIFNASTIDKLDPGILSIDFSPNKKMLICTNSSSIYEISGKQAQTIMTSHCKGQLWAEAWSSNCQQFITGGDDKTLRIFDANTYEQKYRYQMKEQIRGVDWEKSSGELIIVGDYKGNIFLFNNKLELLSKEFKTIFSKTKPRQEPYWIEDIKFSPNGKLVAFGAHGGPSHVEIYNIESNDIVPKPKKIAPLFSSALLSLDWSKSSDIIAGVSLAYQLQFMSLQKMIPASSVKNVEWASWSSKFGYQVKQIHQDVDFSNINTVCVSPSKSMVVSGGDDQKIRLFKFPVNIPKQKNKEYIGHSSHVTKVKFSSDESHLLSVGGNDRTIILWEIKGAKKVQSPQSIQNQEVQEQEQVQDIEVQEQEQGQIEEIRVPKPKQEKTVAKTSKTMDDFQEEEDDGDQFMAVKPWLGAIKEPTQVVYKSKGKAPPVNLQLQFAHGYRTKDCRSNLRYVDQNVIAYHTAGLGVLMDTQDRDQAFFDAHNDDIISFYQHKNNRKIIYSSEMGAKPSVFAWNSQGEKIKEFKGAKKGVSAVIGNQKYVVAACLDDNHQIFLWDFKTGKLLKSQKGGRDVIISMEWVEQDSFVSIGVKHYKFWNVSTLKGETGSYGKNCNILCSVAVKNSTVYAGASDGSLQIWSGKSCTKALKLHHNAPIQALWCGEQVIMTGGSDKTIKILSQSDLTVLKTINLLEIIKDSADLSIRSLDVWGNKILIGTLGSEIYEIKAQGGVEIQKAEENTKFSLQSKLMSGHYAPNKVTNELWGLALYDDKYYATCADDGTVRIWDIKSKQQHDRFSLNFDKSQINSKKKVDKVDEKKKALPDSAKGRCLCVSEQKWIVIGCKDGTLRIFDDKFNPKFVAAMNAKKKEISHVKFSPDGRLLAVGDHLGFIYVYEWNGGKIKIKHKKIKHGSYIKHFDFSRDSNTIHSTCGAYELLFWQAETGKQKTSGATETRNEEWATWNVTLGWPVQGIFEPYMDGTDVNAVDRSNEEHCNSRMKLLVSGDDNGKVRVQEYPCVIQHSESVKGRGHSSHVTNVKFTRSDDMVISTGGQDQTILQWKITQEEK